MLCVFDVGAIILCQGESNAGRLFCEIRINPVADHIFENKKRVDDRTSKEQERISETIGIDIKK